MRISANPCAGDTPARFLVELGPLVVVILTSPVRMLALVDAGPLCSIPTFVGV
jgi:hypothetical protein